MHEGVWGMYQFPKCRKCDDGDLVPFSDFGSQGAPIHFKAWVCTNPDCGYNIKIRNGELFIDEPINDGQTAHEPPLIAPATGASGLPLRRIVIDCTSYGFAGE